MFDESLLQRMQRRSLRQTFDGGDLRAILHHGQRKARIYAPPVDENGAGAALAVVAALFAAGQIEVEPQRIEERSPGRDRQRPVCPVHAQRDAHLARGWRLGTSRGMLGHAEFQRSLRRDTEEPQGWLYVPSAIRRSALLPAAQVGMSQSSCGGAQYCASMASPRAPPTISAARRVKGGKRRRAPGLDEAAA